MFAGFLVTDLRLLKTRFKLKVTWGILTSTCIKQEKIGNKRGSQKDVATTFCRKKIS